MGLSKVFRKLVTNQFSSTEDLEYYGLKFSFRTVFRKTNYSYRCCNCSFEHEYLEYISGDGHINEEVYNRIVKCIVDGQCPHVVKASVEDWRETTVYGIHIASSVAAEKMVRYHSKNFAMLRTGIFELSPHALAVMKNNAQNEATYYIHFPKLSGWLWISEPILLASRSNSNAYVKVEEVDCVEICVRKRNADLLKSVLHPSVAHLGLPKAFEFTMKHKLIDLQNILLEYTSESRVTFKFNFAESAIVYNEPRTLDKILNYSPHMPFEQSPKCKLSELCSLLMRNECASVLAKHGLLQKVDTLSNDKFFEILHRLGHFYDEFKTEIKVFLTIFLKLCPRDSSEFLYKCLTIQPVEINVVKILLSLGASVNYLNKGPLSRTPLIHMLLNLKNYNPGRCSGYARAALELLVYENPDMALHQTAVYLGLKEDSRNYRETGDLIGRYATDFMEHGLFEYDKTNNYALNFLGPFLLQCGFPATRSELLEALETDLHPAEKIYIMNYLDYPRSLKIQCRNTLRKYYSGRRIHKYLENPNCPPYLQKFVLLESVCQDVFENML